MADDWDDTPSTNTNNSWATSQHSSQNWNSNNSEKEWRNDPVDDWSTGNSDTQWHGGGRSFGRGSRSNYNREMSSSQNSFNRNDDSEKTAFQIPSSEVGKVIGRGGSTIKDLQSKSGARIKVHGNRDSYSDETLVEVFGTEEQRNKAQNLITEITEQNAAKHFKTYDSEPKKLETPNDDFVDWDAAINESTEATKRKWAALPPTRKQFYFEDPKVASMLPEEVSKFRLKNNNISVSHFSEDDETPIPNPVETFQQAFAHYPEILSEIEKQGFQTPSPIQCQSWPILLQGLDEIGIAQTGTGKTLAYLLPAMIHIDNQPTPRDERAGPTAVILAPTRELAQQIEREAKKYNYRGIRSVCIYGGGSRQEQIALVKQGVEIVIATPGRLNDLTSNKYLDLTSVSYLVLDEADRMLDMGFEPQIKIAMLDIRPDRQTVMMSATWPSTVRRLAVSYMNNPLQVSVGTLDLAAVHSVTQNIEMVDAEQKREVLYDFVRRMQEKDKVIIFVDKKVMADDLASEFALKGIVCQCIHGDRDQSDREQALADLRSGEVRILVATDVASRGLDIEDITHIFNYDFPRNVEEYVHRIGRTGRAGRKGESITLVCREDWKHAGQLIQILTEAAQEVPPSLVKMAERYKEWKERHDTELAACGGSRRRGGGGGGFNRRW